MLQCQSQLRLDRIAFSSRTRFAPVCCSRSTRRRTGLVVVAGRLNFFSTALRRLLTPRRKLDHFPAMRLRDRPLFLLEFCGYVKVNYARHHSFLRSWRSFSSGPRSEKGTRTAKANRKSWLSIIPLSSERLKFAASSTQLSPVGGCVCRQSQIGALTQARTVLLRPNHEFKMNLKVENKLPAADVRPASVISSICGSKMFLYSQSSALFVQFTHAR
jgi:hypothetical protein